MSFAKQPTDQKPAHLPSPRSAVAAVAAWQIVALTRRIQASGNTASADLARIADLAASILDAVDDIEVPLEEIERGVGPMPRDLEALITVD